jgi:hypothetical protein
MRSSKVYLLILIFLLAVLGAAAAALGVLGDSATIASTGGIYAALERNGQAENEVLRNELYAVVLHQKQFWNVLGIGGGVSAVIALLALVIAWRAPK